MNTQVTITCIPEEDAELAGAFAYELAKNPTDPLGIAMRLVHGDMSKAMQMSQQWRSDPSFQQAVREMSKGISDADRLYTGEELAFEVQQKLNTFSGKLWLEGARFFAELRGYIKKDAAPTAVVQNVIVVPADTDASEWEKAAITHQTKLRNEAKTINGDNPPS